MSRRRAPKSRKAPHDHEHAEREQVIGLLPAMLRLRERGAWSGAELTVTFVPRGLVEGEDPAKVLGAATQVTIGRIAIRQE